MYLDLFFHCIVLRLFVFLVDFQFRFEGKTFVSILEFLISVTYFIHSDTFCNFALFIYLISSVFVVLCIESFGASMIYFQNWFLSQVTGRELVILNFKIFWH